MDKLKDYIIHFVGLSLGNHRFSYLIDDTFFAQFEDSEISRSAVKIELDLNKLERMMILTFNIEGTIGVNCSRCMDDFDLEISGREEFFVKFGDEYLEEDDNVLIIPDTEYQLDISNLIYDYLYLMIPFRVVHPDDESGNSTCNPEVIKRLEQMSHKEEPSSAWDKLKDFKPE